MNQTVPEPPTAGRRSPSAVALVGFMGAGKTTVGRELAARVGWRFLDADELIEIRERRTIEQIFREDGEPAFRRLECAVVRDAIKTPESTPIVLALGGGAFIEPGIQKCLQEARVPTVFLDAHVDELFRRCEQPGVERPLRRNAEQFCKLYEQRRREYLKAAIRVDTSTKAVAEIVKEIILGLDLVPASGAWD